MKTCKQFSISTPFGGEKESGMGARRVATASGPTWHRNPSTPIFRACRIPGPPQRCKRHERRSGL
ncbi:hypothetical protein [Nitratireductor arenosus]|uniref:hypothetical protein n=1 Tax=Nitratireductor arenosus TaxID=2682096 RepID=UPI0031B60BA4